VLTADQIERLRDHTRSICIPHTEHDTVLAKLGLIEIGRSRFGAYSRITALGNDYVGRTPASSERRAAATRGSGDTEHPIQDTAGTSVSSGRAARPNRTDAAITPNAVRVTTGATQTYYPLNTYGSIKHGTKQFVHTEAKLFKSYRMGAPATVADVLCDPPVRV
jgi:hypothetical protein